MVFKQVFRLAFITFIWKQYKAWIVSTIILLTYLFVIGQIHADLLQIWELNKDTSHTSVSLLYKWAAYISGISIYGCYHLFRRKTPPKDLKKAAKEEQKQLKKELSSLPSDEDPFNEIRHRNKLRSRTDFLLDKEKMSSNTKK